MLTTKQKYRDSCNKGNSVIPIFSRDWWLDAVCGEDQWDVLVVERDNRIFASMPICIRKKWGLKAITQPTLTPFNGINIYYPPQQKYTTRLSYEKEVMEDIIAQLDSFHVDYYFQFFSPSVSNWLPFYWAGFQQSTRYTYIISIEALSDLDKLWSDTAKNTRNIIRKAQNIVTVRDDLGLKKFLSLNHQTFARQQMEVPYTDALVERLDYAAGSHGARKIYFAEDAQGLVHAALYVIWDNHTLYSLMAGANPELQNSGAGKLLRWEAIKLAAEKCLAFDFAGSMMEPIERFNRSFASTQTPYFQISKMSNKWKLATPGIKMIQKLRKR